MAYQPPILYKCGPCGIWTKSTVSCQNCGAKRTGKEKKQT